MEDINYIWEPPAKVFHGEFNVEDGVLNFICTTKDIAFQEVKTGLIKLRDEINRQLELEMDCPFIEPAKATPATGKQKYYFVVYQTVDSVGPILSAPFTSLETLRNTVSCQYHNVQYCEFEYEYI